MRKTYYPDQNSARADWWQNIINIGGPILAALGFTAAQVTSIMNDAAWAVYLYRTLRGNYEESNRRVTGYSTAILSGARGTLMPLPPPMPTWPDAPTGAIEAGIEARRELWVQQAKSSPTYNPETTGATLRTEAPQSNFDPNTYVAQLENLSSPAAKQARFKFGKAYGEIDGVNLYGRKTGTADFIPLGRFTATPANATVPLTNGVPEEWDFEVRGVKRDIEIGLPSPIRSTIIRA